jgi:hypothetical protein
MRPVVDVHTEVVDRAEWAALIVDGAAPPIIVEDRFYLHLELCRRDQPGPTEHTYHHEHHR